MSRMSHFTLFTKNLVDPDNPSCAKYIIPPEAPRMETTLSIDLTADGVPADLEWLIIPNTYPAFLSGGVFKFSRDLSKGDQVYMASGRIGTITATATKLHAQKS